MTTPIAEQAAWQSAELAQLRQGAGRSSGINGMMHIRGDRFQAAGEARHLIPSPRIPLRMQRRRVARPPNVQEALWLTGSFWRRFSSS